jgi:DNA-binding NarL/FixJ family response regulator
VLGPVTSNPLATRGFIRVFVCDDVAEMRGLVRFWFENDDEIRIVGEAGDGISGLEGIADTRPDIVLLDLAMPGLDGLELIPRIHERVDTRIVVFSGFTSQRLAPLSLEACAERYVEKGSHPDVLRQALREVATASA